MRIIYPYLQRMTRLASADRCEMKKKIKHRQHVDQSPSPRTRRSRRSSGRSGRRTAQVRAQCIRAPCLSRDQGIEQQVVRPGAHEGEHADGRKARLDHVDDDLEERGQAVAAVHQRGVFDVLGDIPVEEVADDEGTSRADAARWRPSTTTPASVLSMPGIQQYIQNTDEQQHAGEQAQNQEQLLQKVCCP